MNLAEFVKSRRNELRLSLRGLATRCGLSHNYIAEIESGVSHKTGKPISPTIETLQGLAKGLGVSFEELERVARGLPPYPTKHPGWSPETEEAIRLLDSLPEDRRKKMLQALEIQARMLQE